jgi:hypothetical protein
MDMHEALATNGEYARLGQGMQPPVDALLSGLGEARRPVFKITSTLDPIRYRIRRVLQWRKKSYFFDT